MIEAMKQMIEALKLCNRSDMKKVNEAIEAGRKAIAEAEKQEPYAYTYLGIKADDSQHGPHLCWKPEYMNVMSASKGAVAIPLYTRPQPTAWVGLTDEEIDEAVKSCKTTDTYKYFRAIESALKEKNHGNR